MKNAVLKQVLSQGPYAGNVAAYYEMAEQGLFANRRVELIEGEIVEMSPMLAPHASSVALTMEELSRVFGMGYAIRVQSPMILGDNSEPEPDILVTRGSNRDFVQTHPTTALLIVEISDSTLRYDRAVKAGLYARAGVLEYWIVNLQSRQLETFRLPVRDPEARFDWRYAQTMTHGEVESVSMQEKSEVAIAVADLLP